MVSWLLLCFSSLGDADNSDILLKKKKRIVGYVKVYILLAVLCCMNFLVLSHDHVCKLRRSRRCNMYVHMCAHWVRRGAVFGFVYGFDCVQHGSLSPVRSPTT